MREYILDGWRTCSEESFHREIRVLLGFFEGYGANLDALWDVLTDDELRSAPRPFELVWRNSARARTSLPRFETIIGIFRDAGIPVRLE